MDCIEEGVVTQILPGGDAVVTAARVEACASCSAKSTCAAMGGSSKATEVRARNDIGARRGDRVAVALAGSAVVSAAGLLYFLPAVGLIGGAWAGHVLADARGISVNLGAGLGAVLALAACMVVIAVAGKRLGRRQQFVPRISRVLLPGRLEEKDVGETGP